MNRFQRIIVLTALTVSSCARLAGAADQVLPIFDTHLHYSRPAWQSVAPQDAARKLEAAGVSRALVSSSPDEGSLVLRRIDAKRFAPVLRPYRNEVRSGNWTRDPKTPAYLDARLKRGIYKGIGEFHLFDEAGARTPTVRRTAALAVRYRIVLQVHSGAAALRALFSIEPEVRILWAHAGMSEPPAVIGAMLKRHKNLWVGLSFRAGEIATGDMLDPAWKTLLTRNSDRFVIGSDTYVTSRWSVYGQLIDAHRRWLKLLPVGVARAIAYGNAVRLFGSGGIKALEK